ncbi:hypothetical protein Fcan01_19282 [Folsomia candida]|uniref:Uncharacterized protein n=1 Tax=Folsomia candida TaxID=158441 RepID=A0A226DM61_FOLCA|nr:hypothetical protein Fcan01_19282 [Folsomia candida]
MWGRKFELYVLFLRFILARFSNFVKPISVFSLTDLLMNISDCDLQMIHSGDYHSQLSFNNVNLVTTTIFTPDFDYPTNPPSLDTLNSRVSQCRLSFILFVSQKGQDIYYPIMTWMNIASNHYALFRDFTKPYPNPRRLMSNINVIIILVLDRPKFEVLDPFYYFHRPVIYHTVLIEAIPGQNFEICFLRMVFRNPGSDMACSSEIPMNQKNFIAVIHQRKLEWETWCIQGLPWDFINSTMHNTKRLSVTRKITAELLASDIFSMANGTFYKDTICYAKPIITKFSTSMSSNLEDVELMFTENEGYQFLTCYVEPYISFYFYFKPFQTQLWAVLGISILTIVAVPKTVQYFRNEMQPFSSWLFVMATLFEEAGYVPGFIEKTTFFRLSLGVWCVMSVILTNAYNGLMILELNAPRETQHPNEFSQLRCENGFDHTAEFQSSYGKIKNPKFNNTVRNSKLYLASRDFQIFLTKLLGLDWFPDSKLEKYNIDFTMVQDRCYRLLSQIERNSGAKRQPEFLNVLTTLALNFLKTSANKSAWYAALYLFNARHSFHPKEFSYLPGNMSDSVLQRNIEKEIIQCGKTVYIAKVQRAPT